MTDGAPKPTGRKRKPREKLPKPRLHWPIGHPRRPKVYDPCYDVRAKKLALLGLAEADLAEHFGVDVVTFERWKREIPSFFKALQEGKEGADMEIANALYERAKGWVNPKAVKIFMPAGAEAPVYAPYTEYLPPDVGAAKLWLTNRQGRHWRERKEVDHMGAIEQRIALMTPEQRRARLLELQAKVIEVLEIEEEDGTEEE